MNSRDRSDKVIGKIFAKIKAKRQRDRERAVKPAVRRMRENLKKKGAVVK